MLVDLRVIVRMNLARALSSAPMVMRMCASSARRSSWLAHAVAGSNGLSGLSGADRLPADMGLLDAEPGCRWKGRRAAPAPNRPMWPEPLPLRLLDGLARRLPLRERLTSAAESGCSRVLRRDETAEEREEAAAALSALAACMVCLSCGGCVWIIMTVSVVAPQRATNRTASRSGWLAGWCCVAGDGAVTRVHVECSDERVSE